MCLEIRPACFMQSKVLDRNHDRLLDTVLSDRLWSLTPGAIDQLLKPRHCILDSPFCHLSITESQRVSKI